VTEKNISTSSSDRSADKLPSVSAMTEDIVGCKWSMTVLQLVRQGICRPGAMEHQIEGLTSKVLNERLKKLTNTASYIVTLIQKSLRVWSIN
jgi:DNA-binding HxlR family transcriptional regulator